jgi:hypothetical protein
MTDRGEADRALAEALEPPVRLVARPSAGAELRRRAGRVQVRRRMTRGGGALATVTLGGVLAASAAGGSGLPGVPDRQEAVPVPGAGAGAGTGATPGPLPTPSGLGLGPSGTARSTGPIKLATPLTGTAVPAAAVAACRVKDSCAAAAALHVTAVDDLRVERRRDGYYVFVLLSVGDLKRLHGVGAAGGSRGTAVSVAGETRYLLQPGQLGQLLPLLQAGTERQAQALVALLQPAKAAR